MVKYEEMKGKTAIVTGASAGIGYAAALAFAENGANVVIADIQEEKAKDLLEIIESGAGEGIFIKTDVSSNNDVMQMVEETVKRFGGLDYAFNNAGIEGASKATADYGEKDWDRVISVNLKGIWLCMKYEIKEMLKKGKGSIVNTSSIAGKVGFVNLAPYSASKHGINGLTKSAALEYAAKGLRINSVCPGVIKTEMVDRITGGDKEAEKDFINMEPIGRMGTPGEVADAVLWLCSDAASFVTGHPLAVDGGILAG